MNYCIICIVTRYRKLRCNNKQGGNTTKIPFSPLLLKIDKKTYIFWHATKCTLREELYNDITKLCTENQYTTKPSHKCEQTHADRPQHCSVKPMCINATHYHSRHETGKGRTKQTQIKDSRKYKGMLEIKKDLIERTGNPWRLTLQ